MTRPVSRRTLTISTLAAVGIATSAACELFTTVRCLDDADCPASLPQCRAGSCGVADTARDDAADDDSTAAPCSDAACAPGRCYDTDDGSGFFGRCVPDGLDDSCVGAAILREQGPPSDGVLVDVQVTRDGVCGISGGTPVRLSLRWLHRDARVTAQQASVTVQNDNGDPQAASGYLLFDVAGDTTGTASIGGVCANLAPGQGFAVVLVDDDVHFSNSACLRVP